MSKPYPTIHLPKLADHERLCRELWRLGYLYGGGRMTEDETWRRWEGGGDSHMWPYIDSQFMMTRSMRQLSYESHIAMNSVNQFLDYVRRNHPFNRA